jgi:di/tricarboxylate transporter
MPIAFGSLLGGMTTLIGTPPNVIVAGFRNDEAGDPFRLFDFFPVGGAVAVAGVAFIALVGWRLVPRRQEAAGGQDLFGVEDFFSEVRVTAGSRADGMLIKDIGAASEAEIVVAGLVRPGGRIIVPSAFEAVHAGDILVVKADSEDLTDLVQRLDLELVGAPREPGAPNHGLGLVEAVILSGSLLAGRSAKDVGLRARYGVNLLAVARPGSRPRGRLASTRLAPGDVLLLQGQAEDLPAVLRSLSCVPIGGAVAPPARGNRVPLALAIFGAALVATGVGLVAAQVALVTAAVAMLVVRLIRIEDAYQAIDWPVIILLGAMIPVGTALETSGGAGRIVEGVDRVAGDLPPVALITIVLVATMLLSDVVNNAAAAVLMAPIGIQLALNSGSSVDPFLMAVAIGASCAFLTPIGHQSNTLVLVPGGYRFGDYWRMGLPLEVLIVAVAVPLLMVVWPP